MNEASDLEVSLHPLVIINVTDHYSRIRAQHDGVGQRVVGALLGVQTGRHYEVFNSFELLIDKNENGEKVINKEFLETKVEQLKKVFPDFEVMGWYKTASAVEDEDVLLHKQVAETNENPLFLLLDSSISPTQKDLPITLYESEVHVVNDVPTTTFVRVQYKIETGEAERISVDHVAKLTPAGVGSGQSQLTANLGGQFNAIKMLHTRVAVVISFLEATKSGAIPPDYELLRQAKSLCNRLPSLDSPEIRNKFLQEYTDAVLIGFLSTLTKSTEAISELLDKFNVVHGQFRSGRRGAPASFGGY